MNVKTIRITTDAAGAFDQNFHLSGQIVGISLDVGDLSTPDLTLSDLDTAEVIYAKTAIAADLVAQPRRLVQLNTTGADIAATYDAPVVMRTLRVLVAGGGNTLTGTLRVGYRG